MNTQQAISEINQTLVRSKELHKEIAARIAAAKHIHGIPARHNALALKAAQDEYETQCYILDLYDRVGVEEIIKCNLLEAA